MDGIYYNARKSDWFTNTNSWVVCKLSRVDVSRVIDVVRREAGRMKMRTTKERSMGHCSFPVAALPKLLKPRRQSFIKHKASLDLLLKHNPLVFLPKLSRCL